MFFSWKSKNNGGNSLGPIVLIILDGLGVAPPDKGNAVSKANTKFLDELWPRNVHGFLNASGTEVGLPFGVPGNSEIGHLNIGSGKIVIHDLPKIDNAIVDGTFFENKEFLKVIKHVKDNNSKLHILGLVGNGFAHSSVNHLNALIKLIGEQKMSNDVLLHLFTDGRDSAPRSANMVFEKIVGWTKQYEVGKFASIVGRYYAMDRDTRWDRTQKAYDLLTNYSGIKTENIKYGLESNYAKGITDEFITPIILPDYKPIEDNDGIIFINFRSDRVMQLISALSIPSFSNFKRLKIPTNLMITTMSKYGDNLPVNIAFPPIENEISMPLAKAISDAGYSQLHISESEKYPHVTYFFNGERRTPFENEDWIHIPSPRNVATYDLKPEMSAIEVTEKLSELIQTNKYGFVLVNYANPDMVGHTGVLDAGIKAVEVVDECLSKIIPVINSLGGVAIITADHGNVEEMLNIVTGEVDTQHSINPVPILIVFPENDKRKEGREIRLGRLADISPTILNLMGIKIPTDMTGRDLLT